MTNDGDKKAPLFLQRRLKNLCTHRASFNQSWKKGTFFFIVIKTTKQLNLSTDRGRVRVSVFYLGRKKKRNELMDEQMNK